MDIEIKQYLDGAKNAHGAVGVVIDVFRASTTIAVLGQKGIERIFPMENVDDAYDFKRRNPAFVLIGERQGLILPGCEYDNSPSKLKDVNLEGKTVILTTSGGTRVINNAATDALVIGRFVNSSAIVTYARQVGGLISLLAVGQAATYPAQEDFVCAEYLRNVLRLGTDDFEVRKNEILSAPISEGGAERLMRAGQKRDLEICLSLDLYTAVPTVVRDGGRPIIISQ
jgi:2-phosphosulfolactate phosphatase